MGFWALGLTSFLAILLDFDTEVSEPYKIYRGLTVKEMEELRVDIKMHLELDRATKFPKVSVFACEVSVFSPHLKSIDSPLNFRDVQDELACTIRWEI